NLKIDLFIVTNMKYLTLQFINYLINFIFNFFNKIYIYIYIYIYVYFFYNIKKNYLRCKK
ncbi:MAG: hypothetical protein N7Q72_04315, partial [Spiroplasma sp. Tabriz.8]|nr:hypothetical protein [Spiroplasma sp. Tabriz.8]